MNKMKRSLVLFAMALSMVFLAGTQDVKAAALKITGFQQTEATKETIRFKGTAGTNATFYSAILYSDAQCKNEVARTAYSKPEFVFYSLTPGTTYWAKIGYGSNSSNCYTAANLSADAFEVITAPGPVSNVKFTNATEKTVTLTWDKAQGADMYLILTKTDQFYSNTNSCEFALKNGTEAAVYGLKKRSDGKFAPGNYGYINNLSTLSSSIANDSFGLTNMTSTGVTIAVGGSAAPVYGQYWEVEGKPIKGKGKKISAKDKALYASVSAKVTNNTMYQFRVRTYVVLSNGQKKYSKWSGYKYFLHSKGGKTVSGEYGKITVKWKKFKGVDRVVIKMATSENGKYKKVATVKPGAKKAVITKFGKKALQSYKTYSIRIEYQKKVKGKYKTSEIVGKGRAWCR